MVKSSEEVYNYTAQVYTAGVHTLYVPDGLYKFCIMGVISSQYTTLYRHVYMASTTPLKQNSYRSWFTCLYNVAVETCNTYLLFQSGQMSLHAIWHGQCRRLCNIFLGIQKPDVYVVSVTVPISPLSAQLLWAQCRVLDAWQLMLHCACHV